LLSGEQTGESEGAKGYVFSALLLMVGLIVGWAYWFNASFFGHDGPNMFERTATARALDRVDRGQAFSPEPTLLAPTSFAIRVNASPAPTAAPTATPGQFRPQVMPTHTPRPAPTVLSYPVTVVLSSYWPDDGPDWCQDWNDELARCESDTTLGVDWRAGGTAILAACSPSWLGKQVSIPALALTLDCVDTGVSFGCVGAACSVGVLSARGGFSGHYEAILYD
jgi:hypothetical protein